MNSKNKHKLKALITATTLCLSCLFLAPIGVKAAPQEYTLTLADVEYTDNGAAGIRIEGLKSDFATNHSDLPDGNWTMVIPNTMDIIETVTVTPDDPDTPDIDETVTEERVTGQYTVTELAKGTNGFNSTANRIAFEDNCTVVKINSSTFANCENLKYFEFPSSITTLGTFLFNGNTMNEITFSEDFSVTTFDMMVFGSSETTPLRVQSIKMTENIKTLKSYSQNSYSSSSAGTIIETFDWGEDSQLEIAPQWASNWIYMQNCLNVPSEITSLEQGAIFPYQAVLGSSTSDKEKYLRKITFTPDSQLETIGKDSFYNAKYLTEIELPLTVTRINSGAFAGCSSLSYIDGLDNVEYVGSGAFTGARTSKLSFPNIKTLDGSQIFRGDYIEEVEFGGTLETIPYQCFAYSYGLKKVILSPSVTTIGSEAFMQAGTTNRSLVIEGAENVKTISSRAFQTSGLCEISELNNLEELYNSAFSGSDIKNITLGGKIDAVSSDCFYNCRNLSSVKLSENITTIKSGAFQRAGNFTINSEKIEYIEANAFRESDIVKYTFNNHEKFIGASAFRETNLLSVTYTTSPDIDYVPASCFESCTSIKSVTLSDNIKHIKDWGFYENTSLPSIEFPETLETIGKEAFQKSTSLTSVTIPNSVVDIGSSAFEDCTSLKEVNIDRFASWSLDSSENTATIVSGAEGGYAFSGTAITEIRYPETIGVLPCLDASKVKKIYVQGPNVVGLAGLNIKPATGQSARVYFDEETKLRPAATSQVSQWKNFDAIFANGETYDYLKNAGLTNVYKRQTEIELSIIPSVDGVTLTATLTADGAPDNRIAVYYEDTYGRRVEVASQACSTGKTLSQTITNDKLPVGNLKYIAVYEPTDPDGWYACEDIWYYDKGVSNCHFDTIEQEFSATGDLILKTPVICDTGETPRGNVRVYLGENASGKLLHEYPATVGQCSISRNDLPYGDNEIFIEFIPSDVGMQYCNTTTSYNKPAIDTALNASLSEYNNTILVNTNVTPAAALSEGEVSIYLGDEVTGIRMNETGKASTYIPSDYIKSGENIITVIYQSPDGHYTTKKETLTYNFDGGEPTLKLNIYTEYGFVHFAAVLEDYEDTCSGTIRIYKGYDNTGELIYGGSAPTASTKFNLHQFENYGNQTYYAEFVSANMDNKNAKALATYNRESKASSIVGEVTTISDTTVRVGAYAVDENENPITQGKLSIYRGSSSAGILVTEGNCDGNPIVANIDRDTLQVGINEFFIVYSDGTEEYATSTMQIIYTRLSSTEGGTELDKIYNSYEEQLRALILQIEENNKAWQKKFDEIQASIDAGLDLSELNAKIDALEDDIADLNLKLGEMDELKALINSLKKDIQNIGGTNIGGNTNVGGTVNVDFDMDELEELIDKRFKEQIKDIENLLEKLELGKDTETRLSEKDLELIKSYIDGKDLSKEIALLNSKVDKVSEKIDRIKIPEIVPSNPSVDYGDKYKDLYNNLINNGNESNDELYKKIEGLFNAKNKELEDELTIVKNSLDAETNKYDKLARQLEDMKEMYENQGIPDWLKILFVILVAALIIGLIGFASMNKKLKAMKSELEEKERQLDIATSQPQDEAERLKAFYNPDNNQNNFQQ